MNPVERLYLDALEEGVERDERPSPGALLATARSRRRPATPTAAWAAPYAGRVAAMDAVLASASADDWSRQVVEGWTLQQLVAHLTAKDGLVAADVGAPVLGPPIGTRDALGRTAEVQAAEEGRSPQQTRETWRAQADVLCARLAEVDPATPASPDGLPIPVRDAILARGLETWVHADDAARTSALRLPPPVAGHLHPMAGFCVRLLPWTLLASGGDGTGPAVRVTLTGAGGGTWHVPLDVNDTGGVREGGQGDAEAHIVTDGVAFCFLLGGRVDPGALPAAIEGDRELARRVLAAAPAFSGP
ncbi:maleylpyruvate isomerase family mycothiol-dependent enzyme [Actinomadura fulvescens]|uniref:Mycothiol-dependent maleylpyruvate isomerase metal-binding domain-containing protein n=1 Tax=Actinomadura fulvescens TaxID=46160 RepID=A0ABN3PEZ0_9ACTN